MSRDRERFDDDDDDDDEIGKRIKRETHVLNPQMGRQMGALNAITPCAACKLLRRRCAEECPLSPYFSPHEPQKFAAVHKVFGASNVSKMLLEVPESQRTDTANSLVFEANLRLRDPVYGCMGAISALQQQIQSLQAELNVVRSELLKYKYREASASTIISSSNYGMIAHGVISIAASPPSLSTVPPPPPPPPPQQPLLPPLPPSMVVSSSSSSSSSSISSLYTQPTSTAVCSSSITSDNIVPYFD